MSETHLDQPLWDRVIQLLQAEAALPFLTCLSFELTLAARSTYGPEERMHAGSEYSLRSFNELLHRTSMQLCQAVGIPERGYPPDAYLAMLQNEAQRSGLFDPLEWAIRRALKSVERDSEV